MPIKLTNISKSFSNNSSNKIEVLKKINLEIQDKEMVAIMGRSGAGKSTLLNIIGCLDSPDEGEYLLDGQDISKLSNSNLSTLRNSNFGFIMQDFALIEDETVRHNILLPTYFSKTKIKTSCEELAKKLGIYKLLDTKASLLSGGEKQRTAIARAIINDSKYIIADEPTGALDSMNAEMIMNIISDLHKTGKTVIIVTHDKIVAEKCQRVLNISDGHLE